MRLILSVAAYLLLAGLPAVLPADEFRVAKVFTSNAVLQRDVELPVWGFAEPGSTVEVKFAGQVRSTSTAKDGAWQVRLAPLKANASPRQMVVSSGARKQVLQNLLVGEVWYASGQSNMQMTLGACAAKLPAVAKLASEPAAAIRLLRINDKDLPAPAVDLSGNGAWQTDSVAARKQWSAVAYLFARRLHQSLGVPVGVIEGSWGGKPIEGFIPQSQFQQHKELQPVPSLARQNKLDELAKLKGGVVVRNTAGLPGRIFNARIAPVAPFAIRGFIWYQGESNAGNGEDPRHYRIKMQALADGFRQTWRDGKLPFYFVQLPAYKDEATGWVRLREEQRLSLAIPHTGMAVTIDLRDADIHPANKIDVADRLGRWALAKDYGAKVAFSGPLFESATREGDAMRVKFLHAADGLMTAKKRGAAAPAKSESKSPGHFELADKDGVWHPAEAKIDGATVLVRSKDVAQPAAVRYACSVGADGANLYNLDGLPASPFCSKLEFLPWPVER